jgi:FMNH2-dependent dimethyl sulfone monooxygenase
VSLSYLVAVFISNLRSAARSDTQTGIVRSIAFPCHIYTRRVKIGLSLPGGADDAHGRVPTWPEIRSLAESAEGRGFDSVWMCDHFFGNQEAVAVQGIHEAWAIVTAVAATTERVQIGTLVVCTSFRNPGLLAKIAATADEVSGGRLVLGVGAGWHDAEFEAFGYPKDHRVARFEEALQIICPLLDGQTVTFDGRYHRLHGAKLEPTPGRRIPILVAAEGQRMMRLAARYADAWNGAWFGAPDDSLLRQLAALEAALAAEGRDPGTMIRTVGMTVRHPNAGIADDDGDAFRGSIDELARAFDSYADLGIDHLILEVGPRPEAALDRIADAMTRRG